MGGIDEALLEEYTAAITSVETILALERLKQADMVLELEARREEEQRARSGVLKKTLSVPNMSRQEQPVPGPGLQGPVGQSAEPPGQEVPGPQGGWDSRGQETLPACRGRGKEEWELQGRHHCRGG